MWEGCPHKELIMDDDLQDHAARKFKFKSKSKNGLPSQFHDLKSDFDDLLFNYCKPNLMHRVNYSYFKGISLRKGHYGYF